MSSTPPNLLTIPRELRDQIYTHLTKPASFSWDWTLEPNSAPLGRRPDETHRQVVVVAVRNAPVLSVCLTNSLLHAEYTPMSRKNLTVTLFMRIRVDHDHTPQPLYRDPSYLFPYVQHAILFQRNLNQPRYYHEPTQVIHHCISAFTAQTPHLKTFRLAMRLTYLESLRRHPYRAIRHLSSPSPGLPSATAQLHLVQRLESEDGVFGVYLYAINPSERWFWTRKAAQEAAGLCRVGWRANSAWKEARGEEARPARHHGISARNILY
ncbi:hypothetical protein BDV95DRAFT_591882 [Massariosphaeria phaeospora]|uniref:Uncharacterized protein n=1 Tax=Massariosphaeria phaeospora TaxID=100035 RepID=A0A7C8MCW9_9PLEO|nr:hypothetical protein BDV95DRAFT_591882 [Massariosphaeria phaeospora]